MDFKRPVSFDDLLLIPQYSDINSRSDVSLAMKLPLVDHTFTLPLISASMDTVTGADMAAAMSNMGGLGIIHRYMSIEEQVEEVRSAFSSGAVVVGAAIGVDDDFYDRADRLLSVDKRVILSIDIAHGHHIKMMHALAALKNGCARDRHVMAGNIATREAYEDLVDWGADSVKCGIGGGSICTTRIKTGHGVPTLQSIFECAAAGLDVPVIADGGFKESGDIVKGLAAGANFVMLGSMLSGTEECPGEIVSVNGHKYKEYRGMASRKAQLKWRGRSAAPEGVVSTVLYKGSVYDILLDVKGQLKSGVSLSGAATIDELVLKAQWIEQTTATRNESSAHIYNKTPK